jgi:hypothetical protein
MLTARTILKYLIIGAIVLIAVVVSARFLGITLQYWFWLDIVDGVVEKTGLNINLVRALAIPTSLFLSFIISRLIFSTDSKKRKNAIFIFAGVFFTYFLSLYFYDNRPVKRITLTTETAIFTASGEPLLFYLTNNQGEFEFFDKPGAHPQYGTLLLPVHDTIVQKQLENNRIEASKKQRSSVEGLETLKNILNSK